MKSLIGRLFGRGKPAPPPLAEASEDDVLDALRHHIQRDVASGFHDEDTILTHAVDAYEDELEPTALRTAAQRMLREEWASHAAAQVDWPAQTDCDRLDAAFQALEAEGVIARQNFTCCGTCGSAEIWDEIAAVEEAGGPTRGYAFYHVQDTESAVEGYGLYLNYGACEQGEASAVAVGHDIVAQLEAHGLRTEWDGSHQRRIAVSLDWKRRR